MKKSWFVTIAIILLISGYAYFRSVATNTAFLVSLDQTLLTIISEIWKFVSNPTIFIATLIAFTISLFRENLRSMIPSLTEVSGAGFLVKFNSLPGDTGQNAKSLTEGNENLAVDNRDIVIDNIVESLGSSAMVNLCLNLDTKTIKADELIEMIDNSGILKDNAPDRKQNRSDFFSGVFATLNPTIFHYLFDMDISDDRLSAQFSLKPRAKERLLAKAKEIKGQSKKTSKVIPKKE